MNDLSVVFKFRILALGTFAKMLQGVRHCSQMDVMLMLGGLTERRRVFNTY